MKKRYITGTSLLYLTTILWGSAFIPQKWLLSIGFPPLYMNSFRFMFAILLIPFLHKKIS